MGGIGGNSTGGKTCESSGVCARYLGNCLAFIQRNSPSVFSQHDILLRHVSCLFPVTVQAP